MASSVIKPELLRSIKGTYTDKTGTSQFDISSFPKRRPILFCATGCIGVITISNSGAIGSQYFSKETVTATMNDTTLIINNLEWYDNPFIIIRI